MRDVEGDDPSDSSGDEFERNPRGDNIPSQWYKEFDHVGYDRAGQHITPVGDGDVISRLLLARGNSQESKEFRRSVYDEKNDLVTTLTDRELTLVRRMVQGRFPHPELDAEPDYVDYYSGIKMQTSMRAGYESKSKFIPSKWERMKIHKIVQGIKAGTITITTPEQEQQAREEAEKKRVYMLWGKDGTAEGKDEIEKRKRGHNAHVPAPRVGLPGHEASYHPPAEYLKDKKELGEDADEEEQPEFTPHSYDTLRQVPAYNQLIMERFNRCLDLYLCPRTERIKLNIDPESLVPRLPLPKELRPFPTTAAMTYLGHHGRVRSISVDPKGQFLCTGGDDGDLRIWEIESGRCLEKITLSTATTNADDETPDPSSVERQSVKRVEWNPRYRGVIAATCGNAVILRYFSPCSSQDEETERSFMLISGAFPEAATSSSTPPPTNSTKWIKKGFHTMADLSSTNGETRIEYVDDPTCIVTDLVWHAKGEFLCCVVSTPDGGRAKVLVHHVGRAQTQDAGFASSLTRGDVQRVAFHPSKPILFVASRTDVIVYNLVKQVLIKRLKSGVKWISSLAIHPSGDHVICGSHDCKVAWFDLDLSSAPFKTLKYHPKAVREVCFHKRFPLFASVADDGVINIFHATVYDDLVTNPLLVPVKKIEAHHVVGARGVASAVFHPIQPWIFTCGADGLAVMFTNVD